MIDVLAAFDREQRRDVTYSDVNRVVTREVVRLIGGARRNVVIVYSDLRADDSDAIIERELAHAASIDYALSWKWYSHDTPPDLHARLVAHGLEAAELEAVLVLDLHALPAGLQQGGPWPGFEVRRLAQAAEVADVIAVETEVWQEDHSWLQDLAHEIETEPEQLSMYCAYVHGEPASAAWIRFHSASQFASLWGGSTRPAYRQRGLYTALLAVRAQEALARGRHYLTIDAGPMSRPILEKHGFQLLTYAQDHDRRAVA